MIATILLAAAAAATAAATPMPDYAGLPADLAAAARAFDQAQVDGDGKALERLLADDYVLVNSQDQEETKADFIRDYTAPGFTFAPFTIDRPVRRVWADGAVLGGVVAAHGMSDGKPYAVQLRFADIWAKRGGTWRVVFTQATHAPAAK